MRRTLLASAGLALAALALAPGCTRTTDTNAGLTNGPPPSFAGEKAANRTDVPASGTPSRGEALGQSGDTATNSGTGGMGGGDQGAKPEQPRKDATANSDTVRANPPAKGSGDTSSAAGGTKPPEPINEGTPRSPH